MPPIPIKVVIVGDVGCGKSALVQTYTSTEHPVDHVNESPFSILTKVAGIGGDICSISMWDTSGDEEMDRLRPLSYAQADIFFLCFSIVQPESYESARAKWAREVEFHSPGTPIVLVGLMADLRSDASIKARLAERQLAPIQAEQGHVKPLCMLDARLYTFTKFSVSFRALRGNCKRVATSSVQHSLRVVLVMPLRRPSRLR